MANPIRTSDLLQDDGSIKKIIKDLQALRAEYTSLRDGLKKENAEYMQQMQNLNPVQRTHQKRIREIAMETDRIAKEVKRYNDSLDANEVKLAAVKNAQLESNRVNKATAKALASAKGSYNQLSAQYSLNKIRLNQMSKAQRQGTEEGRKLEKQTRELYKEMDRLQRATGKHQLNVGNYSSALGRLRQSIISLAAAYISLSGAQRLIDSIFSQTKALDSVRLAQERVFKTSGELAEAQAFLNDITDRYGVNLLNTTKSYTKFIAATSQGALTTQEATEIFESFTKGATSLGLTADETRGVFLALEQIISKGKVSAEELRGQLGERLPGAFVIAAKSVGKTTQELDVMLKRGDLLAEDLLPKMAKELERTYGLENVERIDNLAAAQERFRREFTAIVQELDSAGVFTSFFDTMRDGLRFIRENLGTIINLAKLVARAGVAYLAVEAAIRLKTIALQAFNRAARLNPYGLLLAGIALLLPHITTLLKRLRGISEVQERVAKTTAALKREFAEETKEIQDNLDVLRDLHSTEKERKASIDKLRAAYPDILSKYDLEKGRLEDLVELNEELRDAIADRLVQERIEEAQLRRFEKIEKAQSRFERKSGRIGEVDTGLERRGLQHFEEQRVEAIEKANEEYAEEVRLLEDVKAIIADLDTGQKEVTITQEQRNALLAKEAETRGRLSKLTTDQLNAALRGQGSLVLTNELVRKIAAEIVEERKAEAAANQDNEKELEKAIKRMKDYRKALAKVIDDIKKTRIDQIADPTESTLSKSRQLVASRQFALEKSAETFRELEEQARKAATSESQRKMFLKELTALQAQDQHQIWVQYYRDLQELRKKDADKALDKFLRLQELTAAKNIEDLRGSVQGDDTFTRDESLQVKILEEELRAIEAQGQALIFAGKANSEELKKLFIERNKKLREISEAREQNELAALQREEQLLLNEVELIQRSTAVVLTLEELKEKKRLEVQLAFAKKRLNLVISESGENAPEVKGLRSTIAALESEIAGISGTDTRGILSLEEFKEKKRLEIQIEFAKRRLALAIAESGENAPEVKALRSTIAILEKELADVGADSSFKNIFDLLGFDVDDPKVSRTLAGLDIIKNQFAEIAAQNAQLAQQAVQDAQVAVQAAQSRLQAEIDARNAGYAHNVQTAQKELALARQQEADAEKIRRKAQKAQLIADSVSQASSLATAYANTLAKIPPPFNIVAGALLFAAFIKAKLQAFQLAKQQFAEGGLEIIGGGSHASGKDTPLGFQTKSGKAAYGERGEAHAVINKRSTSKYKSDLPHIIDALNKGLFYERYIKPTQEAAQIIPFVPKYEATDMSKSERLLQKLADHAEKRYFRDDQGRMVEVYKNRTRIYVKK